MASIQEVEKNKEIIESAGPSPGVFTIAAIRRKLRQSPDSVVSFKRVGIKEPLNNNNRNKPLLSIDFSDENIDKGSHTMEGVQIVNP